jgi:hypothetical protein
VAGGDGSRRAAVVVRPASGKYGMAWGGQIIEKSPLSGTLMLLPFAWGLVAMFVFERFDGKK